MDLKRFKDFAVEDTTLDGDKVKINDLFNKEIYLTDYRLMRSKVAGIGDKECLQLQFKYDPDSEDYFICFTNSTVLIRQFQQYEKELPFLATIKKKGSYYTLS